MKARASQENLTAQEGFDLNLGEQVEIIQQGKKERIFQVEVVMPIQDEHRNILGMFRARTE